MPAEQVASPVVVLLPFEMEYLIAKTGVAPEVFRRWPIDITPTLRIDIGILDLGKPCPFLRDDKLSGSFIETSLRLHVEEKEQLILLGLIQDF